MLVVFMISAIIYSILIYKVRKLEKTNITLAVMSASSSLIKRVLLYQAAFIISWTAGFYLWLSFGMYGCFDMHLAILILIGIIWESQGFLNAMVFIVTNVHLRAHFTVKDWIFFIFAPIVLLPVAISCLIIKLKELKDKRKAEELEKLITNSI